MHVRYQKNVIQSAKSAKSAKTAEFSKSANQLHITAKSSVCMYCMYCDTTKYSYWIELRKMQFSQKGACVLGGGREIGGRMGGGHSKRFTVYVLQLSVLAEFFVTPQTI